MTTYQRVSIAVGAIAVAVCLCMLANPWLERQFKLDRDAAVQHKSMQHALAIVDHVEHTADASKVCYSIASLNELPAADRSFYETTEAARTAGHGPRCLTTHNATAAALPQGAMLDVYFTLANGGKIVIARVAAGGTEL